MKNINNILIGCAQERILDIADSSVDCIVTSPPYWGQRDYGVDGQIGSEKSFQMYIEDLQKLFNQCKRVLKDSGTLWLNLGDKYNKGNLIGLPWRVAIALQDDGWILRNDIIWHKPNAMPHNRS